MKIKKKLTALFCAAALALTQAGAVWAQEGDVGITPDETQSGDEHIHSYVGEITKEATCAEAGEMTYTCECGDSYTEVIPKTTSHRYGVGEVIVQASCGVEGKVKYTCKVCGRSYTETVPALSHQLDEGVVTKKPTCKESGILTCTCKLCGTTFDKALPVDPDAHEWGEGIVTLEPTCKDKGITMKRGGVDIRSELSDGLQ